MEFRNIPKYKKKGDFFYKKKKEFKYGHLFMKVGRK